MPWEWDHFRQQHLPNGSDTNSSAAEFTIHALHAEQDSQAEAGATGFNLSEEIVEIEDAAAILQELDHLQDRPIILLDSLIHFDLADAGVTDVQSQGYQFMLQHCEVLNTTAMVKKYQQDRWSFTDPWARLATQHEPIDVIERPARLKKGHLHRHLHISSHHGTAQ